MNPTSRAHTIDRSNFGNFYIGGKWVAPSTDRLLDVVSPITEDIICQVAEADTQDIDSAVDAAHQAFENGPWPRMTPLERAKILETFAEKLRSRSEDFATAWIETTGVIASMAVGSLEYAVTAVDRSIEHAASFLFIEKHLPENGGNMLVHEPVGVVAAIAPWNAQ